MLHRRYNAQANIEPPSRTMRNPAALWLIVLAVFTVCSAPALGQSPNPRAGVTVAPPGGGLLEALLFYVAGGSAVLSALGVCVSKNIVRMAVWLFVALGAVALLYFMLAANFLGAIQLIVYAGGTLILLIFGVMLTSKSPWVRFESPWWEQLLAGVVCGGLFVSLCIIFGGAVWPTVTATVSGAAVADLGILLMTKYLVPFEVAGVVLMIVMVGAAHQARQDG